MKTEQAKIYSQGEVDTLIKEAVEQAIRQDRELICQIIRAMPKAMDAGIRQGWIESPIGLQEFMSRLNPPGGPGPAPEAPVGPIDTIIRVNRSISPSYPDEAMTAVHPELESAGPAEYDVTKVKLWIHDVQKSGGTIKGDEIYDYLKENDMMWFCLGLRDLEEIRKKGVAFYRKYFRNRMIYGWSGVMQDRNGDLFIPYLCEGSGSVDLHRRWLGRYWRIFDQALLHEQVNHPN